MIINYTIKRPLLQSKVLMKLGANFQDCTAIYVRFLCTLLNWASNSIRICDETTDGVERAPPLFLHV